MRAILLALAGSALVIGSGIAARNLGLTPWQWLWVAALAAVGAVTLLMAGSEAA